MGWGGMDGLGPSALPSCKESKCGCLHVAAPLEPTWVAAGAGLAEGWMEGWIHQWVPNLPWLPRSCPGKSELEKPQFPPVPPSSPAWPQLLFLEAARARRKE